MADYQSTLNSFLTPLPSSSIVGLSTTANSTPAYIIPNSTPSTPTVSLYGAAPSTVIKPATTATSAASSAPAALPNNGSIVDYLNSKGQASDYNSRAALAAKYGIANYTGSAAQNTQLLQILSTGGAAPAAPAAPAPVNTNPAVAGANNSPTPANASDIATLAAKAGLSVSEYQSLLAGNTTVSSAEQKQIAKDLGIPEAEAAAFAKPSQSTQQIYDNAYSSAGLDALHAKILTLIDTINAEKQKANEAVGTVNENPFLTEKSRVGRGQRILNQAQAAIQNDTDLLNQLQGLYTQGVTEVNNLVARTTGDFKDNQAQAQQYLNYLQTKAQQQAEQLKGDKTISALSSATDFLKGTITANAESAASKQPSLVGSAATGYYRWDAGTQSFVQVIKGSGGSTTFTPTSAQKASVAQFLNTDAGKKLTGGVAVTDADLNAIFGDQTTFYALLQQANDAGY